MRSSDWSSDVCSSDLVAQFANLGLGLGNPLAECRIGQPVMPHHAQGCHLLGTRSEERRVGKECVSTCRSRWAPDHYKKKQHQTPTCNDHDAGTLSTPQKCITTYTHRLYNKKKN